MAREAGPVDRRAFAVRREVRDILDRILGQGGWAPAEFEDALLSLGRRRKVALRQLLRFFGEGRVADEVAGLEVLGRLTSEEDEPTLARMVNDTRCPEGARVACGLVLLGRDRSDLITTPDVSGLVLRWQARFVAEEASLRAPLMRLYGQACRSERASWSALQDRELLDAEGRAATFEMLLEIEEDPDLRAFLLEALSRVPDASSRAALRRVAPRSPEERDIITGALAALAAAADPERVPDGWSARIGYCDGTGSFPLRFDFRAAGRRPRSTVFVLNFETGVRESLALSGTEVQRYDDLGPEDVDMDGADTRTMMYPLSVQDALGLLVDAERADRREGRHAPRDHRRARQLLDPLADLRPRVPEPLPSPSTLSDARRSAELLQHPGYAGWFYDAGDHVLDDLRLEVLHREKHAIRADDGIVSIAAERLAQTGEPRRVMRMLRHNAFVHRAAGEPEWTTVALASAAAIASGSFVGLPLVRRMVCESLHPGHYFFTPVPEVPERTDMASLVIGTHRPTKLRALAVDLGLIYSRAIEVWSSRTPSAERPHSDQVQQTVIALAQVAARTVARSLGGRVAPDARLEELPPDLVALLRTRLAAALTDSGFPALRSDPGHDRLLALLVAATGGLVLRSCFGWCSERCPADPRGSARRALLPGRFPAGYEAELYVRTWPGVFLHEPDPAERAALSAFIKRPRLDGDARRAAAKEPFSCALCREERPATARAKSQLVPHDGSRPRAVCRRCRDRYRRDPAYRAEVIVRHGKLL